ncbi:acetyl esterase/lipase [Kineothrix alysoides]|uniref:Acetyl esterase/lipase n=1 Tax=Kineothrix alysoides TaxID=1469948 RepID=A0A4R1QQZ0_9FIRM|nr:alpha/beta hydrolase [Kineothrix alysoides]TCL56256.1 acetyl esterase/lipase [Kineothrix alysoides]
MKKYSDETVMKMMGQTQSVFVHGVSVELKCAEDGNGPGTIDPRILEQMKERRSSVAEEGEPPIAVMRKRMIGTNYNQNTFPICTKYLEIDTTCGKVPGWMYYPVRMEGKRPCFMYVHGGAFFGGSVITVENGCRLLAERSNSIVCNIDYSLPPETPYPVPTTQIYESLNYLSSHASFYQIDEKNIFIGGDSAGGNMSAAVTQMDRDRNTGLLKGEVLIYPKLIFANDLLEGYERNLNVFELVEEERSYLEELTGIGSDESNERDAAFYVQGQYDLKNPYISPMLGKKEGLPKTLMIQAEYDGLRLEGEYYAKLLKESGVPVRMIRYCNVSHGFVDQIGLLPQAEAAINEIAAFINE